MDKPFSQMTDAEKRAWADAQTAPKSGKPTTAAAGPKPGSAEAQVEEIRARRGQTGYFKGHPNQSTDHMN